MDRKFIKVLIDSGIPFSELGNDKSLVLVNNQITEVYIKNGLHRQMTVDKFNEEVKFNAVALCKEIMEDKVYAQLRDQELHYIFSEGMKGRLGTDKDIVITFKSLLRWIEGYVRHPEYKEACKLYEDEHKKKPIPLPAHEMTDDDFRDSVMNVFNEYVEYRKSLDERKESIRKGFKPWDSDIMSIGEVLGPPIGLSDYGGFRRKWLVEHGYAKEGEKLVDVFSRAIANGNKFIKITQ